MTVSLLAVFVAALVSMIIGSLWYSPLGFGNLWMAWSAIQMPSSSDKRKMRNMMVMSLGGGFVVQLVMSYMLAYFLIAMNATEFSDALALAGLAWLGFMMPLLAGVVLWEMKTPKLFLLNSAYWLLTILVMAGIYSSMI